MRHGTSEHGKEGVSAKQLKRHNRRMPWERLGKINRSPERDGDTETSEPRGAGRPHL